MRAFIYINTTCPYIKTHNVSIQIAEGVRNSQRIQNINNNNKKSNKIIACTSAKVLKPYMYNNLQCVYDTIQR